MNDEIKKKVDENWKTQAEKEKGEAEEKAEKYYQPTFTIFLSSLSMQAMISLGKLENPLTEKTEKNLEQARFLIDTLAIIKDKTKNNLTADEGNFLDDILFNLRTLYLEERGKND